MTVSLKNSALEKAGEAECHQPDLVTLTCGFLLLHLSPPHAGRWPASYRIPVHGTGSELKNH